jgi:hypothetical protein
LRAVTLICGTVLLVCGASFTVLPLEAGQTKPKPPPPPKPAKPAAAPKGGNNQAAKPVAADQLQKMLDMSPEDRQKTLAKLPPEQRKNVENRLNALDKMTPEKRAQQLDQTRRLESLPPARRKAVTDEMKTISDLPQGAARRAIIQSPEFQKAFSPEEQQLIRDRFPGASK